MNKQRGLLKYGKRGGKKEDKNGNKEWDTITTLLYPGIESPESDYKYYTNRYNV